VSKTLKTYCPVCNVLDDRPAADLIVVLTPAPELRFYCDGCNDGIRMALTAFDQTAYKAQGVTVVDAPVPSPRPGHCDLKELEDWAHGFLVALDGDITAPQT
jgi:hypothetical protein